MKWDLFVVKQTSQMMVMSLADKLLLAGVISRQDYLDIYGDTIAFLVDMMEDEDDPELLGEYQKMAKGLTQVKEGIEARWREL